MDAEVIGVEARPDLVELTNRVARESGFARLRFERGAIGDFAVEGAVEADAGAAGVGRGGAGVVAEVAVAPMAVAALGSAGRGTWKMMACP